MCGSGPLSSTGMIKFKVDGVPGKQLPMIGLGITTENVKALKKDQPIIVRGEDLQIEYNITIIFGETTDDILGTMKAAGLKITLDADVDDCCSDPNCKQRLGVAGARHGN